MKPLYSIIIFVALIGLAATSGISRYRFAEDSIVADMNQALARTLAQKQDAYITPDTINSYRSHLRIEALRRTSLLSYATDEKGRGLRSRKMRWSKGDGQSLTFQGYANCDAAAVLAMSDQRLPAALSAMAMMWAMMSVAYFRWRRKHQAAFGDLTLDDERNLFVAGGEVLALTPMQQRLMEMLFRADGHQMGKRQICSELWPKKPDATETLYTLVRRIKPVIARAGLTITTSRGRDYKLTRIE